MKKNILWVFYNKFVFFIAGIYTIFTFLIILLSSIIFMFTYDIHSKVVWFLGRSSARLILFLLGCKVDVSGLENIPYIDKKLQNGKFCIIANHTSNLDIVSIIAYGKVKAGFIAKKSLSKIPILNYCMKFIKCVFLERSSIHSNIEAIKKGVDNIKNNIPMIIFPEGTRCAELSVFKEGSMKLATRSNCYILPLAIKRTRGFLESREKLFVDKHIKAAISYLEPIDVAELDTDAKDNLSTTIHDVIAKRLEEL